MVHRYTEVPAMLMLLYKSCDQGYVSWGKEVMFQTMGRKGKEELILLPFRSTNGKLFIVSKEGYIGEILV